MDKIKAINEAAKRMQLILGGDGKTASLGIFPLTDVIIDAIEDAGYCLEQKFNQLASFIWFPAGLSIDVGEKKQIEVYVQLSARPDGVYVTPFVGPHIIPEGEELARLILAKNAFRNETLSRALNDKKKIPFELSYTSLNSMFEKFVHRIINLFNFKPA